MALKAIRCGGARGRLAAVLMLTGCAPHESAPISTGERYVAADNVSDAYLLGADDKLRITVFGEPQLSGEYLVAGDGTLSLPLIGTVAVASKTTENAAHVIEALLASGYLRNPRVSIEIASYRPFFILGEVKSPGQYPYVNGLTVTNAIATAQGYTPRARKKIVMIRRFGETTEQAFLLSPNLRVQPGDTIRLTERYF